MSAILTPPMPVSCVPQKSCIKRNRICKNLDTPHLFPDTCPCTCTLEEHDTEIRLLLLLLLLLLLSLLLIARDKNAFS